MQPRLDQEDREGDASPARDGIEQVVAPAIIDHHDRQQRCEAEDTSEPHVKDEAAGRIPLVLHDGLQARRIEDLDPAGKTADDGFIPSAFPPCVSVPSLSWHMISFLV